MWTVGKHFLNFKLHADLHTFFIVDVHEVQSRNPVDGPWKVTRPGNWERWERNWMGL